jgi:hypothetical protein
MTRRAKHCVHPFVFERLIFFRCVAFFDFFFLLRLVDRCLPTLLES